MNSKRMIRRTICLLAAMLCLASVTARAVTIQVSQPIQVTNDTYYERGQAIRYGGGYYWLFYGRSATVTGNYGNDNPDVSDYQIYFKKATSVEALDTAAAYAISAATNCYLGEIGAAYFSSKIWAFATVPSTNYIGRRSLYGWYSTDGTSWTQVADIADNLPDGAAHHDEIKSHGMIYVAVNRGATTNGWSYLYSSTPETGGWSGEQTIPVPGNGLAHFFVDADDSLYLGMLTTIGGATNRILRYDGLADSWAELGNASSSGWDPTLFKVGSDYVFAQAPWSSGRQWVIAWYGTDLSTLLSGSSKMVSEGEYGTNVWVEMWPIGFTDEDGNSYLFYTSERNPDDPSSEITGNIWYLKVDWGATKGLAYDHYTYIQEAIDGATGDDVINVASGAYEEQIRIDGKSLDLIGAGIGQAIIDAVPVVDRTTYTIIQWNGSSRTIDACVGVTDAGTVNVSGFTIDGKGLGPNNFYGIHYFNTDGSVTNCQVEDITDLVNPGNSRIVSLLATHGNPGSFNVNFSKNVIPNFQKGGIVTMGPNGVCTVDSNDVDGALNASLAPNGIQVSYGSTGSLTGNSVSGVGYSGPDWTGSGIILFECEDVTVTGGEVNDCQTGLGHSQWNWIYTPSGTPTITVDDVDLNNNQWSVSTHVADSSVDLNFEVKDCSITNATYVGVELWGSDIDPWGGSYYGGWIHGTLTASIHDNNITNCDVGIEEWIELSTGNTVNCAANNNNFTGSASYGVYNNFTNMLDATANWWGDPSGPNVVTKSVLEEINKPMPVPYPASDGEITQGSAITRPVFGAKGSGAAVSSNVDYSPWWGANYVGDPHTTPWTWYVDTSNGSTIQEGIDAASAGDVLNVAGGTYNVTTQVLIDKSLTLIGEDAATTIIDGPGSSVAIPCEGLVAADGVAGSVSIKNFTLQDAPERAATWGIYLVAIKNMPAGASLIIEDNILIGRNDSNAFDGGIWIAEGNATSQATIRNNDLSATYRGMVLERMLGPSTVENNDIHHLVAGVFSPDTLAAQGLYYLAYDGEVTTQQLAKGNTFRNYAGRDIILQGGHAYISDGKFTNVRIQGNVVDAVGSGPEDAHVGITLYNDPATDFNACGVHNAEIFGNAITTGGTDSKGIVSHGHNTGIDIHNNQIDSLGTGILVEGSGTPGVTVNGNSIAENTVMGLDNSTTVLIDASGNWWGTNTPAGVAGEVSASVDYTPWLDVGTDTDPGTFGFQGDFSVLSVDDDSPQTGTAGRIQEGIDLVTGSTVNVAAGTYSESIVFASDFDKDGLIITGDGSNRPAVTGGVRFLQTGIIDGITFENLYIKGLASGANLIFDMDNSGAVNDFVMDSCVIDGENISGRSGFGGQNLSQSFTITYSEFKNILGWAVMDIESGSGDGGSNLPFTTVTFADNYVHECNGSVALRGHSSDRTDVANVYGNVFSNIGGNQGEQGQHWAAFEVNHADGGNIYDNDVDSVAEGQWGEGQAIQLWDLGSLDMYGNSLTDCFQGIFFFGGSDGGPYGGPYSIPAGAVHDNIIAGNSQYGISVDPTATGGPLNAECNWWGSISGPYHAVANPMGQGNSVSENVDFEPWSNEDLSLCQFTALPDTVWVDDDYDSTNTGGHYWGHDAFDNIQDGVDRVAAAGVVIVAGGTYEEQVVITTADLTLIGAGSGSDPATNTIVKSPVDLQYSFNTGTKDCYPIMGMDGVTGTMIRNLRVDGAGRGNNNYSFCGLAFWNAGGTIEACYVTGVRDEPFSGAQHGVAIYAYNNTGGPYTVNLSGTTIDDFQKNAMALSGGGLTVNVSNCTVTGQGPTSVTAQNGIQISLGAGGTVTDCSVSGIAYTGGGWVASGMLFYLGTTVDVSGFSSVSNSQANIVFQGTDGSVDGALVTTSGVVYEEGVSIRDYGYNKGAGGKFSVMPVSPVEEELYYQTGPKGAPTAVNLSNLTLTGVHEPGSYGVAAWAISSGDNVTVSVTGSNIQDWEYGFVAYEESPNVVDVTATSNNISSNDIGFWTSAVSLQNATGNWWGAASGPLDTTTNPNANGDEVGDNVDYSPWWGDNYVGDPHANPWTWYVNTSNNSTIQEGIDAAASLDELRVRPGTYVENDVIDKSLALLGAGEDSVLVYPATSDIGMPNPDEGPSFRGSQMCVVEATDVTIEGFTFDGDNPTLTPEGTIDARNAIITNYNTGDWSNLKVSNCTVKNIYLRAIYASAQTPNNLTGVDFSHNTVSNVKGSSMQSAGIMLWGSSGNATHNDVSDASLGIFYHWNSDGNMDSNVVTTSELGLGVNNNDLLTSISNNSITHSGQGVQSIAVSAPVSVQFNAINGCTSGVVLYGGGPGETSVADNEIEGPATYGTQGVYASTDLTPWGLGDLSAHLKGNIIKNNFYGMVLNEPPDDRSKILSLLVGGSLGDYNLIYDNLNCELLMEYCDDDQTATHNYWGYSLYTDIEDEIYHQVDQSDLGFVAFDPAIPHGDANLDCQISAGDIVYLLNYLYRGGDEPPIFLVADANRDGEINASDVIYLINYLYRGGDPPLAAPFKTMRTQMDKLSIPQATDGRPLNIRDIQK